MTTTVSLKLEGVDKAIKQINNYQNRLDHKIRRLMFEIAVRGYNITVEQLATYPMPASTGELMSNIDYEWGDRDAIIYVVSEYAIFVEFGTGIVGENNSYRYVYPEGLNWQYDINGWGEEGWIYRNKFGDWYRTRGQVSKPFMYESSLKLAREIKDMIKEAFAND